MSLPSWSYYSEQMYKFVAGQITLLMVIPDLKDLSATLAIREIISYYQVFLIFLERRSCWLPWLQGIYVRTLELGFQLHYDTFHFHIIIPVRHPLLLPPDWMSLFEPHLCSFNAVNISECSDATRVHIENVLLLKWCSNWWGSSQKRNYLVWLETAQGF